MNDAEGELSYTTIHSSAHNPTMVTDMPAGHCPAPANSSPPLPHSGRGKGIISHLKCSTGSSLASFGRAGLSSAHRSTAALSIPLHLVQQAVLHGPDHHLLFRIDSQFVLNAIDRVPGGHDLVALGLGDLGV